MLTYCQLNPQEQSSIIFNQNTKDSVQGSRNSIANAMELLQSCRSPRIIFIQQNIIENFSCKVTPICWDFQMLIWWGCWRETSQWGGQKDYGMNEAALSVVGFMGLSNKPTVILCLLARSFHHIVSRQNYLHIVICLFYNIVWHFYLFCTHLRDILMATNLTN